MKKKFFLLLALVLGLSFFSACKKEGVGGTSSFAMYVKHHSALIPFAKVYIKYDAKEFPGAATTLYNDSITTNAGGHAHFEELIQGDYYLYGVGWDSSISQVVKGGIYAKLKKGEELEIDVPVTE